MRDEGRTLLNETAHGSDMSRKFEGFKPNPRRENAIILTKKSVARSQLETAISLWFQHRDPVSTLVLAYNAHEILHALGAKIEKPSQLKTWLGTTPKRFQKQFEYVWNFCKHGLKDVDDNVPHDPRHAELLITLLVSVTVMYSESQPRYSLHLIFDFSLRIRVLSIGVLWAPQYQSLSFLRSIRMPRASAARNFSSRIFLFLKLDASLLGSLRAFNGKHCVLRRENKDIVLTQ